MPPHGTQPKEANNHEANRICGGCSRLGLLAIGVAPASAVGGFCAPHPARTVSIGDDFVYENQVAQLEVTLSGPSCTTVTVHYNTQDSSAVAGSDYVATSGALVFSPGQTSKVVNVAIIDDSNYEGTEGFWVRLTSPTGATIGDGWGRITISGLEPAG